MAARFTDIMGRDVEITHVPLNTLEEQMGEESQPMFEWFNESGYEADLAGARYRRRTTRRIPGGP